MSHQYPTLAFRGLSVLQTGQTMLSNPPTKLTMPCGPSIASESEGYRSKSALSGKNGSVPIVADGEAKGNLEGERYGNLRRPWTTCNSLIISIFKLQYMGITFTGFRKFHFG